MKHNLAAKAAPSGTHRMGKQDCVLRPAEFLAVFHGLALAPLARGHAALAGGFAAEQRDRGEERQAAGILGRQHLHSDHLHLHCPHGKPLGRAGSPAAALEQTGAHQGDLSPEVGEAFSLSMLQATALQLSCLLRTQ